MPNPQNPTPKARSQDLYNRQAQVYSLTRWPLLLGRRRLLRALDPKPGEHILDLGCGPGTHCRKLAALVGPKGRVLGADSSTAMLGLARRKNHQFAQVEFAQAHWPHSLEDQTFDAVLCSYSLALFDDWQDSLPAIAARLRPGGRIAVLDFAWAAWPLNKAFTWHGVHLDSQLRPALHQHFDPVRSWTAKPYGGAWHTLGFLGHRKATDGGPHAKPPV